VEEALERRAFVRKATTDAVTIAGRFYSLSKILSRSMTAAGQSMVDNLENIRLEQTAAPGGAATAAIGADAAAPAGIVAVSTADPAAPPLNDESVAESVSGDATSTPMPVEQPAITPPPEPPKRVLPPLTDGQTTLLATARTAVLGVNRAGLGPHLTPAQFEWDGSVIRIPSLGWAARIGNIRREPRVTVFVEDPASGDFGSIGGIATIAEGRHARGQSDGLLAKYHGDADPDERWAQLIAEDVDRVVIVVEPDQAIWGRRG
jgi:hypothetical protein